MPQEFEAKVLDINVKDIESRLKKIKAKKESEFLMKRWVFEMDSPRDEWIRLRHDGKKATITYKHKKGSGISETEEIEMEVEDFDQAAVILSKLNFKDKYYQENKRKLFRIKDIEFAIDTWPKIPTYLEVESTSEKKVKLGLAMLNLENKDVGNLSVKDTYKRYGINIHDVKQLKF